MDAAAHDDDEALLFLEEPVFEEAPTTLRLHIGGDEDDDDDEDDEHRVYSHHQTTTVAGTPPNCRPSTSGSAGSGTVDVVVDDSPPLRHMSSPSRVSGPTDIPSTEPDSASVRSHAAVPGRTLPHRDSDNGAGEDYRNSPESTLPSAECRSPEACELPGPALAYGGSDFDPVGSPLLPGLDFDDLDAPFLGSGASGSVHALLSVDFATQSPVGVAVKVIDEKTPEAAAAAGREVAFAQRLRECRTRGPSSHRIVAVHRVHRSAELNRTTVTMELLPGSDVSGLPTMRRFPRPPPSSHDHQPPPHDDADAEMRERALAAVARDALEGLAYLHDTLRVVHRDLKPPNLLLDHTGRVKIADFGMAVAGSLDEPRSAMDVCAVDQAGTLGYLSPERLRGEPHGAPSDLWALGVSLLQLALGGVHPLELDNESENQACTDFFRVAALCGALDGSPRRSSADEGGVTAASVETRPSPPPPHALRRAIAVAALSADATDFFEGLLSSAPCARPTAAVALSHTWLKNDCVRL